jgi:hypothetical protein
MPSECFCRVTCSRPPNGGFDGTGYTTTRMTMLRISLSLDQERDWAVQWLLEVNLAARGHGSRISEKRIADLFRRIFLFIPSAAVVMLV